LGLLGHETITLQTTLLSTLPSQIASLEGSISALRALSEINPPASSSPNLALPLPATLSLLAKRQRELADLQQQRKALQQVLPRKTMELEQAEEELQQVEARWEEVAVGARDAVRRREEGGRGDELESKGRWLTGVEAGLREILGVEG
jgi:chromosome segregation ATPase